MSRLGSRSTRIIGVAAALGFVLVGGVSAAAPVPSAVSSVSGNAVVEGTVDNAVGMTIRVSTWLNDDDVSLYEADVHETVIGADGTYAFDVAYATNYYILLEPNAEWQPNDPTAAFDTPYAPAWGGFAAIPGTPATCDIEAVPTSTITRTTYDYGSRWNWTESTLTCNDDVSWYGPVYRFWSPKFNNAHFFTNDGIEANHVIEHDRNWLYEGVAFSTLYTDGDQCTAGIPVSRFYSPVFQSHFYTMDAAEKAQIIANDRNWNYEGIAYCAYPDTQPGTTALYRFWSPGLGKHFFTADLAEKNQIVANDRTWDYEGIAYYVVYP